MPSTAKQTVEITSLIKGILNSYPGNSAIFREYLQNSDDAKATKQIFVLDVRRHPTASLVDPILADTQGPALIAWNDQILSDRDWTSLKRIHASSKSSDESQTGKNGLGFRASYHLTENPQILSGRSLLILDPHDEFHQHAGGAHIDIVKEGPRYADQLRSFETILKEPYKEFRGTVFRLPFRTQQQAQRSRIKNTPTVVAEIEDLLANFVQELEEAILFLKHITSIEIRQVSDAEGQVIGRVTIDPRPNNPLDAFTRRITVEIPGEKERSRLWKYYHYKVDQAEATAILSRRLRYDVGDFMTADKLTADVELAVPLDPTSISGRLFTLLPLPIRTGFPVHFNAVFALTPDRQSLKNIEESGAAQSRERCLIEWNRTIFEDFGVKAWARLLSDLAGDIDNVWSAWPPDPTDKNTYWISLIPNIIQETKTLNIYPIISSSKRRSLVSLTDPSVLLAPPNPPISLDSLAKMGASIVQPPPYIFKILALPRFKSLLTQLSPAPLYKRLRAVCAKDPEIPVDSALDIEKIAEYLVFWGNTSGNSSFERLIALPWFTFVDGSPTSLLRPSQLTETLIVPGSEEETLLFDMPRVMLAWPCISDRLRNALPMAKAREALNVTTLTATSILPLLQARFSYPGGSREAEDFRWLLDFWKWISGWKKDELKQLALELDSDDLHILPTASGALEKWSNLSILLVTEPATDLLNAWRELGISVLHEDLASSRLLQVLQHHKIGILPSDSSYVSFLARNCRRHEPSSITSKSRNALRSSIQPTLSLSMPISLSTKERTGLSALPVFSVHGGRGPPSLHQISGDRRYVMVDNDFPLPILPSNPPPVYIDMTDSTTEKLAQLVDADIRILNEQELLMLAVQHWSLQPPSLMETLVERILENILKFRPAFYEGLKDLAFITVEGRTQRAAPRDVIDPSSRLAELYRGETGRLPNGRFSRGRYLRMMQNQRFFRSQLDPEIVKERLRYLASKQDVQKSTTFLRLLNTAWDHSFAEAVIANQEVRWMPHSNSPSKCRDMGSPQRHYLYDHTFAILPQDCTVWSLGLRKALGWEDVPFKVLAEQFSFTIREIKLVDRTERLKYLISHFANDQTLSSQNFDHLREIVKGVPWVPVHNRKELVSLTQHATLSATSLGRPFYQAQQASESRHNDFLSRMGCTDRPSIDTLAAELKEALSPKSWSLSTAIHILHEIADYHQETISARSDILIPTDSREARPLANIYFQDMKSDSILEIERSAAHSEVSKGLAEQLGIPLMSSLQLEGEDDDEDDPQMSEDFVGRIRKFLKNNDIRFALNVFLANADDVGAKQFSMKLVHQGSDQAAATIKVVSPEFQKLERIPRLIMWSDSVFTEEDFKGIRRVGLGGKTNRDDTHGRHGLGALSFYYFTDVPMVISGDHILILDPSSKYLPPRRGQKRTSLFRKLSVFMRQFPDQLQPLHGNFDFTPQQVTYNGTFFLLPLSSTFYEKESPDYRSLLRRTYRDLAANAFFFTRLTDIKFEDGAKKLWGMSVVNRTNPLPLTSRFTHHLLQFTRAGIVEKWMIATSDKSPIPESHTPIAQELKCLPNSSMPVQLAIRVDRRQKVDSEPSHLFSTLPLRLPKNTTLPFHIHAQFAVSPNRQDLVFHPANQQNTRDSKSSFNAWILRDLVCPLYLAAFGHIIQAYPYLVEEKPQDWLISKSDGDDVYIIQAHPPLVEEKSQDWLIFKSDSDDVSSYVRESILGHLAGTDSRLFASADRNWLTFQQSIFSCDEPKEIEDVLTWLKAPTFVPGFRHSLIPALAGAKKVTIAYLMKQLRLPESFSRMSALELLNESATTEGAVGLQHIIALAEYVQTEPGFVGLPIVIATTGKLYKVPSKSDPPIYVSQGASHWHGILFPTSVFMREGYDLGTIDALTKSNLCNIHHLTTEGMIGIIFTELDAFAKKCQSPSEWLRQLWGSYNILPGLPSFEVLQRSDLKIIESIQGYISLADCTPENVVQPLGPQDQWIIPIMSMLGISVLKPQEQSFIQQYIQGTFPDLFTNVVQCLRNRVPEAIDSFGGRLDEKSHLSLARWMRGLHPHLDESRYTPFAWPMGNSEGYADYLKDVLCHLPIWEACYEGRMQILPAHLIQVLPSSISLRNIEPYLTSNKFAVADYSRSIIGSLSYCLDHPVQVLTIQEIFDILELPRGRLRDTTQIRDYKEFLQNFLEDDCAPLQGKLRVPDDSLLLRLPEELFSRQVALFAEALKYTPQPSFIHESFRDLTSKLYGMGLQCEINFQNFQACANMVELQGTSYMNDDTIGPQEIMGMADSVFQCYCEKLPRIFGMNYSQWSHVDNIAFVRRKPIRREGIDYPTENYCIDLPLLLPPSMLLRSSLEPIAWTVRGLFFTEPSDHLLAVNQSLGVPGADQVVEHLRILSTKIAEHHPGNTYLLSDLRATYKWLDSHHQDAREFLAPLADVPLFLNVDDPQAEPWPINWIAADQLVLNLRSPMRKYRGVREFLQPYQSLLVAAGCHDLKVEKHRMAPAASVTDDMSKLRTFNEMRRRQQLTDVYLVPTASLIYTKWVHDAQRGLPAHKAFLAASIPHFQNQLDPHWVNDAKIEIDRSPFVAQAILDFAYMGCLEYPAPESEEEETNLLHEFCALLHKSDEWDIPGLKYLVQKHILEDHNMIQQLPHGFDLMYATATRTGADALKSALDRFRAANGVLWERLRDGGGIEETQQEHHALGGGGAAGVS